MRRTGRQGDAVRRAHVGLLALAAALPLALALGVSGCGMESRVVSSREAENGATLQQQREWVAGQAEAVIAIAGGAEQWIGFYDEGLTWEHDSQQLIEDTYSSRCTFEETGTNPTALQLDLWTKPFEEDNFALAGQVREFWEAEGWEVSDVIRMGDTEAGREIRFRADREDGAFMVLSASNLGGGRLIFLTISSACSRHASVLR